MGVCPSTYGAFERGFICARSQALGGSITSVADDGFAAFHNPAGICQLSFPRLSLSYSRPYGLKELNHFSGTAILPGKRTAFAVSWKSAGFSLYREQCILFSIGIKLSPKLIAGVSLNYFNLSIARYGSRNTFNGDIGVLYDLTDKWRVGGAVRNLRKEKIGQLPFIERSASAGVSYQFHKLGRITVEESFDEMSLFNYSIGIEIIPQENFCMRFGFRDRQEVISGGFGFLVRGHRIDYAIANHSTLGYTHSVSLSFKVFH